MTAAAQLECEADMAALELLWGHCFRDTLPTLVSQLHAGIVTCCNMIAYNCVLKLDLFASALDPRDPVLHLTRQSLIQMDDDTMAADVDFVVFLIELLCAKPAFVDIYRGLDMALPELVDNDESAVETTTPPDNHDGEHSRGDEHGSGDDDGLTADFTATSATSVLEGQGPSQRVVVSAQGIQAKAILLNFLQHRIVRDDHRTAAWPLLLPASHLLFLAERFGLLAYVAQDQEWWGSDASTPAVLQFLAVLATLEQAIVHLEQQVLEFRLLAGRATHW